MADLDTAVTELYSMPATELDRFAARRAELVAAARADGNRELARAIAALKKPVLAAALVNALAYAEPAELAKLADLGSRLREAHRHLRGAELRELSEERQRLLNRLTELARSLAGKSIGDTVLGQLRSSFEAAIADESVEHALRSGRLTVVFSYSGFGDVDLADAVTVRRRLTIVPDLPEQAAESGPDTAARGRAQIALQRAESAAKSANQAVSSAAERLAQAKAAARELMQRIAELEAELTAVRGESTAASTSVAAADREYLRAERAAERAEHSRQLAIAAFSALDTDS